jgi:hypothetical protein
MHLKLPLLRLALVRLGPFLLGLMIGTVSQAAPRFAVKPPPAWTRPDSIDTSRRTVAGAATGSASVVLDDCEMRVTQNSVERYYRYAMRIETQAGLDELSQLKFYFEPSYQQLTLHFIRIHRGSNITNALNPSEVKTIQQEHELDQQLYNGTFASIVFMNDLRVGDVVDYAYTISGENPVFGGHFADRVSLADSRTAQKLIVRLLWPTERPLNLRHHNTELKPLIKTIGSETEYLWELNDVPAFESEDSTPGWVQPYPTVELSDFKDWGDVVLWALPLYTIPAVAAPDLAAKIEKWKTELKTPEERTLAALRFVQDEVRYLGIELGRYSHQPTAPAKVFARRFGDCKDKSFLLATILNAMGIEATPALVNSSAGKSLDERQPSPFAFNHVIVQAQVAGKTYWFDSTISFQRGGLGQYYDPPYARALVLRPGNQSLDKIPPPGSDVGNTTIKQVYTVSDYGLPVPFVITTTYRGADADAMRYRLSSESLDEFGKANLNYYANQTPSIRMAGRNEVDDDQNSNVITITEHYIIDNLWTEAKHYFYADQIYQALTKPSVAKRSTPFEISYPTSITQIIEIELPHNLALMGDSDSIGSEALLLSYKQSTAGRKMRLEYSLRSLSDHVTAAAIGQHLEAIDRMRNTLGIELPRGRQGVGPIRTGSTVGASWLGPLLKLLVLPLLIVLIVLGFKMRARKARKAQWGAPLTTKVGATVSSAISVRTADEITSYLKNSICDCGNNLYSYEEAPPVQERFRYDGQSLTGVRLKCAACRRSQDFYFRQEAEAVQPAT